MLGDHDLLELLRVVRDHPLEREVGLVARFLPAGNQRLARKPDEQDDHDQWEESAAEEAIHERGLRIRVPE